MNKESKIVQLKYSIPIPKEGGGNMNVSELTFGRLKAKHLRLLPDDFMEKGGQLNAKDIIPLIAGIADIPESSADEIDFEDLMELAGEITSFLPKSPQTGEK